MKLDAIAMGNGGTKCKTCDDLGYFYSPEIMLSAVKSKGKILPCPKCYETQLQKAIDALVRAGRVERITMANGEPGVRLTSRGRDQ